MTSRWYGGANGYLDQDGEWARSSGYTYRLNLFRSVESGFDRWYYFRPDNYIHVDAKLSIWGDWKRKPRYIWTLSVSVNNRPLGLEVSRGSTTSIESCKRQALTTLENVDAIDLAIRDFYSRKNVTTISTTDGIELMSVFDFASGACSYIGAGEYLVSGAAGNWELSKDGCCTSMRSRKVAA